MKVRQWIRAGITRLTTPNAMPEGVVFAVGISLMAMLFLVDYADGEAIRLHVLYVFPLAAIVLHCGRRSLIVAALLLSIGFQVATLLSYGLPGASLATDSVVAWAASALTIGLALATRRHYLRILNEATTDPLTGLDNRRGFDAALELEIARQKRYGAVFSLVMLDLDRFKALNDSNGHRSGDEALKVLGRILSTSTRASDAVARVGGDEFAILMPNTQEGDCNAFCRNLDATIAEQMDEAGFALTASIGHETFHQVPPDTSQALQLVDEAMYSAKRKVKSA